MLNDRMLLVHFLGHGRHHLGRRFKLRPIDHRAAAFERSSRDGSATAHRQVLNFGFADFGMRRRGHPLHREAAIYNGIIIDGGVVDDGSLIVNLRHLGVRQSSLANIVMREIVDGDKGEMVRAQSKVEANADAHAIETPTGPDIEVSMWRHRRPIAIIARKPPGHLGQSPHLICRPDPAGAGVREPASIMKRRQST